MQYKVKYCNVVEVYVVYNMAQCSAQSSVVKSKCGVRPTVMIEDSSAVIRVTQ